MTSPLFRISMAKCSTAEYDPFMRSITGLLAAFLSLLLISSSASASACDFSCWLRQTGNDCHATGTEANLSTSSTMAMDMSARGNLQTPSDVPGTADLDDSMAGMDMTSSNTLSNEPMAVDIKMEMNRDAQVGSFMPMLSSADMPEEYSTHIPVSALAINAAHRHSGTSSLCAHETCSQIAASASPPHADHRNVSLLNYVHVYLAVAINLNCFRQKASPGTSPPQVPLPDGLAAVLRI
jgi:hypothetical protein